MRSPIQRKYSEEFSEFTSVSKILIKDKKSSNMYFLNPNNKRYEKVHVDGGVITNNEEKKCDYLLAKYDEAPLGEYFVELKGSDVRHGIEQLGSTIKKLSVSAEELDKYAFVIFASKCTLSMTEKQLAQEKFKKAYGFRLKIERMGYEHPLYEQQHE